jgi:glucose dehydrogenase
MTGLDLWRAGFDFWRLAFAAQSVMAMRMLGMAGAWNVAPSETRRMAAEKPPAFLAAGMAAASAAMQGDRPDQIARAAMRPLRRRTVSNANRLARRGPKLPG